MKEKFILWEYLLFPALFLSQYGSSLVLSEVPSNASSGAPAVPVLNDTNGLNIGAGQTFDFNMGGYHFIGDLSASDKTSPEFQDLGYAISYFVPQVQAIIGPAGVIPVKSTLVTYTRGLKMTANFSHTTEWWTFPTMSDALRQLELWANARFILSTIRVSIYLPPANIFLFQVSRVPNRPLQLIVDSPRTTNNRLTGFSYPSDQIPAGDALRVLNDCLEWAMRQPSTQTIIFGLTHFSTFGGALFEFSGLTMAYTYSFGELQLLLRRVIVYFTNERLSTVSAFSGFIFKDGETIGYLTLTQSTGIPPSENDDAVTNSSLAGASALLNASALFDASALPAASAVATS